MRERVLFLSPSHSFSRARAPVVPTGYFCGFYAANEPFRRFTGRKFSTAIIDAAKCASARRTANDT